MKILILRSPKEVLIHWPKLREGFKWLVEKTRFDYPEDETFQTVSLLSEDPDKAFIALAYDDANSLVSFIVVFDSTPLFSSERSFMIYALKHQPHKINITRRLINDFEIWALARGARRFSLATRKYGEKSVSLFSRLGFKKDCLLLTKEI